jgi:cell division protein FtsL
MKYLFIGLLILASGMLYFMHQSNKASAERLKQAEIAHQQKLKSENAELIKAQQAKEKKAETDIRVKELQSKYQMDYLEAKKVVESPEISKDGRAFYVDLAGRWSDAFKVANSTSRIALSQPVKDMQQIKRDLEGRATETACEAKLKQELLKSYDFAIDGFLQFMQKNEVLSTGFISASSIFQENANALIEYC